MRERLESRKPWVVAALATLLLSVGLGVDALTADAGEKAAETVAERAARLNPKIEARIELGRRLFYEPVLSKHGRHACSNCHAPEHGFSDPDVLSADETGLTRRHSQTIIDAVFNPSAHWDGEFSSVEELIARRIGDQTQSLWGGNRRIPRGPITPRDPVLSKRDVFGKPFARPFLGDLQLTNFNSDVPTKLAELGRYEEGFKAAFGKKEPTLATITLALAAYCYSVESTEAPFDRYRAGDETAMSDSAKRGMQLFEGRAGCAECHISNGPKPLFSDFKFHNTGVAWHGAWRNRDEKSGLTETLESIDKGHGAFGAGTKNTRAFKTPTLRDVARRGPFLHDGHIDSLEGIVRYYAEGCGDDPAKDKRLKAFECSDQDVTDLVAFLHALTGDERPGLAKTAWKKRARRTKLQVVDPEGNPVANVTVRIQASGDAVPVKGKTMDDTWTGVTNSSGWVRYPPPAGTHARVVFADGLQVIGSPLIPDTCREATVQIPSRGRMSFVVVFPEEYPAPPALVLEHRGLPKTESGYIRSTFPRVGSVKTDGTRVARYSGWVRTDCDKVAWLKLPGLQRSRRSNARLPEMSVPLEPGTERRIDLTAN